MLQPQDLQMRNYSTRRFVVFGRRPPLLQLLLNLLQPDDSCSSNRCDTFVPQTLHASQQEDASILTILNNLYLKNLQWGFDLKNSRKGLSYHGTSQTPVCLAFQQLIVGIRLCQNKPSSFEILEFEKPFAIAEIGKKTTGYS